MPVRITLVAVVLALGVTCGVVALSALSANPGVPAAPGQPGVASAPATPAADRYAVSLLHDWDARRASAWAHGDRAALAGLYALGSAAGRADARLMRRYADRGLVVRDLRMQVLRARVLVVRPARVELEVTDRLAGATAVRADDETVRRALPAGGPTTRRLVLRREAGRWLMASVTVQRSAGR